MVELGLVTSLMYETVRLRLKNVLKPWRQQQWRIPKVVNADVDQQNGLTAVIDPPWKHGNAIDIRSLFVGQSPPLKPAVLGVATAGPGNWRLR